MTNVEIEKAVTRRSRAREYAWLHGLYTRPWPAFALLAIVGAVGALVLETKIERAAGSTSIQIGGVFSILLLTVTVLAVMYVSRYWANAKRALFPTPDHKVTTFLTLSDAGMSYGVRDQWHTDLAWRGFRGYSIQKRHVSLIFGGIKIRIPKEHLSEEDMERILEFTTRERANPTTHPAKAAQR